MTAPGSLSLHQAPPIAVPFRFFLTAPAFLLAAAAVLLWDGPAALAWRSAPGALAATHLVTLGFMAMVMCGALMQILPVLAAAPIPHSRAVAIATHATLGLGAAALAAGFLFGQPLLMKSAAWLLGAAFFIFIVAVAVALARASHRNATVNGAMLAVTALAFTAVLGFMLAAMYAWGVPLANTAVRALHPVWGVLGWTGLLVASIAFQVVPMFQMTPQYPGAMSRWFPGAAFASLCAWSFAAWYVSGSMLDVLLGGVIAGGYALFAIVTLWLQHRRRRRQPDATTGFWRLGMLSAFAACVAWVSRPLLPSGLEAFDVAIGVLALVGCAVSVIQGMLYKIVPFLAWFHLQAAVGPRVAPHMKRLLPDAPQRLHVRVHAAAVALLLAATAWPQPLAYAAALALGASALILMRNIALAARSYRAALAVRAFS